MSKISPLKDYRDVAGMGSRSRLTSSISKPPIPKYQLYERQEELPERSRVDDKHTPEKHRIEHRELSQTRQKERLTDNLEHKIESILKHNSHLLNENAALGELLNQRNGQLEVLERRLEAQMNEEVNTLNLIEIQKNKFVAEVEEKLRQRDNRINDLCVELSHLNEQNHRLKNELVQLEQLKHRELSAVKDDMSRASLEQVDALKRAHQQSTELYELQFKKFRQTIDAKQHTMESAEHEHKLNITKLEELVGQLKEDLKHQCQMRELELAEAKLHYDNMTDKMVREATRTLEAERNSHEMTQRKLRKELADKTIEVDRLSHRIHKSAQDNQVEYQYLRDDKEKVELAMVELQGRLREEVDNEKQRIRDLTNAELATLADTHKQHAAAMQAEIGKLFDLCQQKSTEIERLNRQAEAQRAAAVEEQATLSKLIAELRTSLQDTQRDNQEELELLKVKMAQLFTGDIHSLRDYYQNQELELAKEIAELNRINADLKKALEREVDDKAEQRKSLELELSNRKIEVAELRMKLMNATLEMKESVANIGSKMELTSETLLREAHHKERTVAIQEDEKKKLHELIKAKDREIEQLTEKIERQRKEADEVLARKEEEVSLLKRTSNELDGSHTKEREFFNRELKKKEALWKQEKEQLQKQLEAVQQSTYDQLKKEIAELRRENLRLQKEVENYERQLHGHIKEIAVHKQSMEVIRMESSVALETSKEAAQRNRNEKEQSLRGFYEESLRTKDRDIDDLQKKLQLKEADLKELILKYNALQKKLSALLETQDRLREFESKVMNLGADANLLKNMAEMIRGRSNSVKPPL